MTLNYIYYFLIFLKKRACLNICVSMMFLYQDSGVVLVWFEVSKNHGLSEDIRDAQRLPIPPDTDRYYFFKHTEWREEKQSTINANGILIKWRFMPLLFVKQFHQYYLKGKKGIWAGGPGDFGEKKYTMEIVKYPYLLFAPHTPISYTSKKYITRV